MAVRGPGESYSDAHPADLGDGAPLMSSESPSAFTEAERQAFAFAEEVGGLAVRIVGAAVAEVVFEREADPKLYAT
jgi:hypothetical protein